MAIDRMDCDEAFMRLDDYLDRELSADERRMVDEHLAVCAACSEHFAFERSVLDRLRERLERLAESEEYRERAQAILGALRTSGELRSG